MTVSAWPDRHLEGAVWIITGDHALRPGFYRSRLVSKGPFVPVCLAEIRPDFDEDGEPLWDFAYELTVDGATRDAFSVEGLVGEPISAADYRYMMAMRDHAVAHEPDMPEARPRQPVDWNNLHFRFGAER